ncbi:MAG: hypothetical protein U0U33_16925 [Chitinophagaceae bacterium]
MKYRLYIDVIAGLLILLFVYTALSKLDNYSFFQAQLSLYPFIGLFGGTLAWAIPAMELIITLLLLIPAYRTKGLKAALILLIAFTVYLLLMILYTPDLPCSCGGVIQSLTWTQHIFFNCGFIMVTLVAVLMSKHNEHTKKNTKEIHTH